VLIWYFWIKDSKRVWGNLPRRYQHFSEIWYFSLKRKRGRCQHIFLFATAQSDIFALQKVIYLTIGEVFWWKSRGKINFWWSVRF